MKFCYYDNVLPIMKCALDKTAPCQQSKGETYVPLFMLNDNGQPTGHMLIRQERIFDSEQACLDYARTQGAFEPEDITVTPCEACIRMGKTCDGQIKFSDGQFGVAGGCAAGIRRKPV